MFKTLLGKISNKYKTLNEWNGTYSLLVEAKELSDKTRANRLNYSNHILAEFGDRMISDIKPHEIALFIQELSKKHPSTANRVFIQMKDMLNEAVSYEWINKSPMEKLKSPRVRVARKRISMDDFKKLLEWSKEHSPPWVCLMLLLAVITGQRRGDLHKMKFSDIWDDVLHVVQEKTGTKVGIPLGIKLDALGLTLEQVVEMCKENAGDSDFLIRKSTGKQLSLASMSFRFEEAREGVFDSGYWDGTPPSLHECRSLSEREFREQGIDTKQLLGHSRQSMTDMYNNDRGLTKDQWKVVKI